MAYRKPKLEFTPLVKTHLRNYMTELLAEKKREHREYCRIEGSRPFDDTCIEEVKGRIVSDVRVAAMESEIARIVELIEYYDSK